MNTPYRTPEELGTLVAFSAEVAEGVRVRKAWDQIVRQLTEPQQEATPDGQLPDT